MNLRQHIILLFKYFEKNDKQMIEFYIKRLSRADEETICKRIEYLMDTCKFMPKISEILEPLGLKIESQMESDWGVFINTMNNNYRFEPIPDWVITIKTHIGIKRCDDIQESELHWLKKEYEKVYPLVKNGTIPMKKDHNKYKKIGGVTVKLDNSFDMKSYPLLAEKLSNETKLIE